MRALFDKNIPDQLGRFLAGHVVEFAANLGWGELKNGVLLATAELHKFDVMITADQNIKYQQNLTRRKIALVVLGSNRWPLLREHIREIQAVVAASRTNSYSFIEVPLPPKPKV